MVKTPTFRFKICKIFPYFRRILGFAGFIFHSALLNQGLELRIGFNISLNRSLFFDIISLLS